MPRTLNFPPIIMLTVVRRFFSQHPLVTNMFMYGTMYTGAEVTQQFIMMKRFGRQKRIDWEIIGRYALVAVGVLGPPLYFWYRFLDAALPSSTRSAIFAKVIIDQAVAATGSTSVFYVGMSILEGKPDIFAELKAKFIPTYTLSCCFWLPAQAINFAFLPPYTRVAFVGAASFVWVNVLCLVKRQGVQVQPKRPPVEKKYERTS